MTGQSFNPEQPRGRGATRLELGTKSNEESNLAPTYTEYRFLENVNRRGQKSGSPGCLRELTIESPKTAEVVAAEKCYPSRMPLKSATTSTSRANPAKGCNNVTCHVAAEITIRQPQVYLQLRPYYA